MIATIVVRDPFAESTRPGGVMSEYRYQHFSVRALLEDMRFPPESPAPGEPFPDFDLPTVDGGRLRKADIVGKRPMFMVAASYT